VYAWSTTPPQDILKALALEISPQLAVAVSGGASSFPIDLIDRITDLLRCITVPPSKRHDTLFTDGGTNAGVMKILGQVLQRDQYTKIGHSIDGQSDIPAPKDHPGKPLLIGFAPEPLVAYPGAIDCSRSQTDLDPNHPYFVLMRDAQDWGDEVPGMFSFLDYYTAICNFRSSTLWLTVGGLPSRKRTVPRVKDVR
jgi:SLOG in TRPM, prokaryote